MELPRSHTQSVALLGEQEENVCRVLGDENELKILGEAVGLPGHSNTSTG